MYIFKAETAEERLKPSGHEIRKRKRMGLPFHDSEFRWEDPERLPETWPDSLKIKKRVLLPRTPLLPPVQPEDDEEQEEDFVREFGDWMRHMEPCI